MRLVIKHTTRYHYTDPVSYSIQLLRLTPRHDEHQRLLRWHIDAPGLLEEQVDAYGNITHTLTLTQPHDAIELKVTGLIDVSPLHDGAVPGEDNRLPVQAYCVPTALIACDDNIRAFARDMLPGGLRGPDEALKLAEAIEQRVAYEPGITDVRTAASQVLALGHGVCQDHAHLFLSCAHALGRPARYVSGYLHTDTEGDRMASHAWADVWWPEHGWVSIDVTNRQYASEHHCRLAVARDYDSASPVRGVRTGGGEESMQVDVLVQQ